MFIKSVFHFFKKPVSVNSDVTTVVSDTHPVVSEQSTLQENLKHKLFHKRYLKMVKELDSRFTSIQLFKDRKTNTDEWRTLTIKYISSYILLLEICRKWFKGNLPSVYSFEVSGIFSSIKVAVSNGDFPSSSEISALLNSADVAGKQISSQWDDDRDFQIPYIRYVRQYQCHDYYM